MFSPIRATLIVALFLLTLLTCTKNPTGPVISGWEVLSIGTNVDLFKVDFVDQNYGWVIGRDTVVFHTTDGGNTWVRQPYPLYTIPEASLHDIHFIDRDQGWAVGSAGYDGLIYKTTDGGQNWFIHDTLKGSPIDCVIFTDPSHAWVCSRSTSLSNVSYFRTTDGGDTWIPVYSNPYQMTLLDFVDSLNGWARGNGLLRTFDGGINWQLAGSAPGRTLDFADLYHGWSIGGYCIRPTGTSPYCKFWVDYTSDGGNTWKLQLDTLRFDQGIVGPMELLTSSTAWIAKYESGKASVFHTTNGGNTWVEQPLPPTGDNAILDIDFINEKEGWAVGGNLFNSGIILRTKNGGNPYR